MGKVKSRGKKKLLRLCEREDWTCYLCGGKIPKDYIEQSPLAPSRDHVVPKHVLKRDRGRYNHPFLQKNVRLAHRYCNNAKDNKHSDSLDKAYRKFLKKNK